MFRLPDLTPPSPASLERAKTLLRRKLGSRVLLGPDETESYRSDDSRIVGVAPAAVVLAETTSDLGVALDVARATSVPITPRAGGSGRTGGAVPVLGGIVLATERLTRLVDLDPREGVVVVEPGVVLDDLQSAVEREGWFYPPDPNSSAICRLAGNVAENAAGPRAYRYGATRDYVLGIETFLATGESFFAGRRTKKGVTGYDLVGLLVGSEGTLAAFGAITLRLIPKPEGVLTLLSLFTDVATAARAVERLVEERLPLRCVEFLDEKTLDVMRAHGSAFRADAGALLLLEVDGSESECLRLAEIAGNECTAAGALEVSVAATESSRKKLWDSRKQMSHAVRARARHKLSEDVVVPRTRLTELLASVRRIGDEEAIDALAYGHAGDGNLHVNFLWNDDDEVPRVERAIERLFRETVRLGGTLSGEHGIGLLKAPYLHLEQSNELVALQERLKASFDPAGLMNPGKIFPRGHRAC